MSLRSTRALVVLTLSGILSTSAHAKSLTCPSMLQVIETASSVEEAVGTIKLAGMANANATNCLAIDSTDAAIACIKSACVGQDSASDILARLANRSAAPLPAPTQVATPPAAPAPAPAAAVVDTEDRMAEIERRMAALEAGECPPCDCPQEEATTPAPAPTPATAPTPAPETAPAAEPEPPSAIPVEDGGANAAPVATEDDDGWEVSNDADGDGWPDIIDPCMHSAGTNQDGCPAGDPIP